MARAARVGGIGAGIRAANPDNQLLKLLAKRERSTSPRSINQYSGMDGLKAKYGIKELSEHHSMSHNHLARLFSELVTLARKPAASPTAAEIQQAARQALLSYLHAAVPSTTIRKFEALQIHKARKAGRSYISDLDFITKEDGADGDYCIASDDETYDWLLKRICDEETPACFKDGEFSNKIYKSCCWPDWNMVVGPCSSSRWDDPGSTVDAFASSCTSDNDKYRFKQIQNLSKAATNLSISLAEKNPDIMQLIAIARHFNTLDRWAQKNRKPITLNNGSTEMTCVAYPDFERMWVLSDSSDSTASSPPKHKRAARTHKTHHGKRRATKSSKLAKSKGSAVKAPKGDKVWSRAGTVNCHTLFKAAKKRQAATSHGKKASSTHHGRCSK